MNLIPAQRGLHWDSTLEPVGDNRLRLMLRLRIHLDRYEPGDRFQFGPYIIAEGRLRDQIANQEFVLLDWLDGWWDFFCIEFRTLIERVWGERFVLVPNQPWFTANPSGNPTPAIIECGLSIQVLTSDALSPHFTFHCFIPMPVPPATGTLRSSVSYGERRGLLTRNAMQVGRSVSIINVGGRLHQVWFFQQQILHEFGHILGLGHVNGTADTDQAYGTTLEQRENIMGAGMNFSAAEAQPWLTSLQQHLIPQNDYDRSVQFTGQVSVPQLITYWDDGPVAVSAGPCVTVPRGTAPSTVQGPAGALWRHLPYTPPMQ